ncbi:MAG: hypothetical protein AAGN35_19660 [Bacteroidota bacterium]
MHKRPTHHTRATVRGFTAFFGAIAFLAVWGKAQVARDFTHEDPRLKITDHDRQHPELGTGFVAEIDLTQLPPWEGKLSLQPVVWPYNRFRRNLPQTSAKYRGGNPIAAIGIGIGKLFSALGAKKSKIPLTTQTVFPLDSGIVREPNGSIRVEQIPPDHKLRLYLPHALLSDSERVYFVFSDAQFAEPPDFLYTPELFPKRLLPDLQAWSTQTTRTRYAGAEGEMVTVHYRFPPYLLAYNTEYTGITPHFELNGQYLIPDPGDTPRPWKHVDQSKGNLKLFVPYALTGDSGKCTVKVHFWAPDMPARIGDVKIPLKLSPNARQTYAFSFDQLQDKQKRAIIKREENMRLGIWVGGIKLTQITLPHAPSEKKPTWRPEMSTIPIQIIPNDTLELRAFAVRTPNAAPDDIWASFWFSPHEMPLGKHRLKYSHKTEFYKTSYLLDLRLLPSPRSSDQ